MYIEGRMPVEPMISIRKYLYSDSAKTSQAVAVDSESTQALYGFASGVLECINQHVLSGEQCAPLRSQLDRKSTRLNSSHLVISYAVFCLKKKKHNRASR